MTTDTLDPVAKINALVTPTGFNATAFQAIRTTLVGVDTLCPSPMNPRKHFGNDSMAELVESVKKHGVLEPILVRLWPSDYTNVPNPLPMYEIVAGERRWRAAKAAGMQLIEAKVRDLTDHEMLEIQIIENLMREGLTPLEEAEGYERMMKEYGYTSDTIADKIGKSKAYVYARLKLTALCHEGRKAFDAGKLTASTALLIARIPTTALQEQATLEITNARYLGGEAMSYRQAADHIQRKFMLVLTEAPFSAADADLVPTAGTCKRCPKRTGNAQDLFDDVKNPNVCTDPECYESKVKATKTRQIKDAKDKGIKVVTGKEAEKILPYGLDYGAQNGMIALDQTTYIDGKKKTYRELIGDNQSPVTLVEDKRGAMVEVVEKKQIAEALKSAGITSGNDLQAEKQRELERKAKVETVFRRALHDLVRAKTRVRLMEQGDTRPGLPTTGLVIVASTFFDRTWQEHQKRIVALWAPTEEKADWPTRIREFPELTIQQASANDLRLMLIDLAVIGETTVSAYQLEGKPERLMALADFYQIDVVTLKKTVATEEKAKTKGKAKLEKPPKTASPVPADAPAPILAAQADEPKRAKTAQKAARRTKAAPAADDNAKQSGGEIPLNESREEKDMNPAPAMPANENPIGAPVAAWPFPTEA